MNKRFHAQRLHLILSLDTLLYQLHTLSFFLSPSIWLYIFRLISQFHCSRPRELDPTRTLRFFYTVLLVLNLPNLWNHSTRGALEGRAIILDFVGMSYLPSKYQLFSLDLSIIFLQLLLITIAYETSIYYNASDADSEDVLLPDVHPSFSIPLFQASLNTPTHSDPLPLASPTTPTGLKMDLYGHNLPLIMDLRFNLIIKHLRHPPRPPPPPTRPTNAEGTLPLTNTTPWPLPGIGMLMRAGRQMRATGTGGRGTAPSRDANDEPRFPGGMETPG